METPNHPRFAGGLVGGAVLVLSALVATGDPPAPSEAALFEAVNGLPGWLEPPMVAVEQVGLLGSAVVVGIVAGLIGRRFALSVGVAAAGVSAWWLSNQLKDVFDRARPTSGVVDLVRRETSSGFGYPSTHAAVAAALAAVLAAAVLPGGWRWAAAAMAVLVGVARVYVGVHYPLDVVGGAALGVVIGTASGALLRLTDARRSLSRS